jgi:CheY-like chemotaxis protein
LRCSGRILVVSDSAAEVAFFAFALKRRGHAVVTAATCEEARAAAEKQRFQVLVAAQSLPDGSGRELADALREAHGVAVVLVVPAAAGVPGVPGVPENAPTTGIELTHPVPVVALLQAVDALLTGGPAVTSLRG